jgi:hypothetical protein
MSTSKNAHVDAQGNRLPYIGESVIFVANPGDEIAKSNHNYDGTAAVVTRIWSYGCVNLKIFPDCGPVQDRTSVVHQSLNTAGYHFRYPNEDRLPREAPSPITEETADASAFLKQ